MNLHSFAFRFRTFEGVVAIYLVGIMGSFTLAMTALAVMSFSAALFEIPTGVFSDRIGRTKTIALYSFACLIAHIILFVAPSSAWVFLGVIVNGLAIAFRSGTVQAFVYENLVVQGTEETFHKVDGHRQSLERYALAISGLIGAAIIYFYDIRTAIAVTLVIMLLANFLVLWLKDVHVPDPKTSNVYSTFWKAWVLFRSNPSLRNIGIGKMLSVGGEYIEYRFRALYLALLMPDWLVNLLGITNNFISGIVMKYTHKIVERFGFKKVLVHFSVFDRFFSSVMILIHSFSASLGLTVVSSVSYGSRQIASDHLLQKAYSKNERATIGSIVGLGGSLIYGVLAVALGLLADTVGIKLTILVLNGILLSTAVFYAIGITYAKTMEKSR